jgi:hypothetical protein
MQMFFRTLLTLYFSHLLTDFVLQTEHLVAQKRRRHARAYALHGIIHYLSAVCIVGFFVPGSMLSLRTHLVIVVLVLAHLLIDFAKIELTKRSVLADGPLPYLADQVFHFATILVAARLLAPTPPGVIRALLQMARNLPDKFLAVPVLYLAVVFGGGYLIRFLTTSLAEGAKNHSPEKTSEQLQNAGLYIGWLERSLVITALLLQSPATIGLILTAKSIARYPEFKSERFAEYFLIGTLLSIAIAVAGGALLAKIIFGHLRFT